MGLVYNQYLTADLKWNSVILNLVGPQWQKVSINIIILQYVTFKHVITEWKQYFYAFAKIHLIFNYAA